MAQSVIGALRVNLGLDSAKFESGARRIKQPLAVMRSQLLAVTGVAAAVVGALSVMATKGANDIDKAAKASRRLGSSIGGYRALELAAGEAGVSLSALTNDVQTMDREIARGSKNAVSALDRLGLSAKDLEGLEADQKVALISDKIKELGLDSGQASALLQDLGVRNREMVLAVLGGGDVFRQARTDIEEYGLAMSATDSAAIELANDRIGRLGLIGQLVGQQLAVALVPTMGALALAMTDSLREGGLLRAVIDGLTGNLDLLVNTAGVAVAAFGSRYVGALVLAKIGTLSFTGALVALKGALLATGVGALIIGAGLLVTKFTRLVSATGGWGAALSALGDLAAGVWSGIKISAKSIAPYLGSVWSAVQSSFFGMLSHIQESWSRFLGNLGQDLADVPGLGSFADKILQTAGMAAGASAEFDAKAQGAANSAARLQTAASSLATQGFEKAREAAKRLSDIVSAANEGIEDTAATLPEVSGGLDAVAESAGGSGGGGGAGGALGGVKDKVEALKDSANEMKDTFKGAFKDLVTGAKDLGDVVSDVLNKIADKLLDSAFDLLLGGGSSGGGFLGGLLGGIFPSAKGNVFSGGASISAFANGGVVNSPTLFPMTGSQTGLMGEAGPEAIMPLSRGANGKLGVQTSGGVVQHEIRIVADSLTLSDDGVMQTQVRAEMGDVISSYDSTSTLRTQHDAQKPRRRR